MNTNTKGRQIFKGPRGGYYVLQDGKKIYSFKRMTGTKPSENKNTENRNSKGRTIFKGIRGGYYVLHDGKKIYSFKRMTCTKPSENRNSKGRTIFKGIRGGYYVLQDGKKIYSFKRTTGIKPAENNNKQLTSPMKRKLIELARKTKRRLKGRFPVGVRFSDKLLKFNTIHFSNINGKRREAYNFKNSVNVKVPFPNNVNKTTNMVIEEDKLPVQSWIDAQSEYLKKLPYYDLYTAASYTVRSHEWIGPWLRSGVTPRFTVPYGHIVPLFPQIMQMKSTHKWVKDIQTSQTPFQTYKNNLRYIPPDIRTHAMEMYVQDLKRIVRKAPPLPRTMYVFRGLSRDIFKGKTGAVHKLDEFASAGYVPQTVYASHSYMRIKLLKGTRVLLLQGLNKWSRTGEFEVLLNKDSRYIIRSRNITRPVLNYHMYVNRNKKIKVTDITVYN
jgi:hypothetical protein